MKTKFTKSFTSMFMVALTVAGLALRAQAGPVAQLIWATQPGNATSGQNFGTQPVLETADAGGEFSTEGLPDTLYVTVRLSTGAGLLMGTTNYNIGVSGANGMVNFSDLQIGTPGNGDQLIASVSPAPGAVLWVDANDLGTLGTNSAGNVTSWTNKGVLGASMVVPAGNFTAPTLVPNSMNGRPVVRFNFNGVNNNVLSNRWANPALDNNNSITFFMALRETANPIGNWSGFIGFANANESSTKHNDTLGEDSGYSNTGFRIIRNDTAGSPGFGNGGQFTTNNYPTGIGASFNENTLGSWYNLRPGNSTNWVNTFWMDGSGNGADYWVDQFGNTWTNFQVCSTVGAFNITDVGIGMQMDATPDNPDWPLPVDIGELVVYNTALNNSDQLAVQAYLSGKWLGTQYANAVSVPFNVIAPGSLVISQSVISDGDLILSGSGGTSGASFRVVSSTDASVPLASWGTAASGNFDGSGNFNIPVPFNAAEPAHFFRLVTP